ncbi:MAG: PhoH family protein, partial [Gammaproteobacteria bacterium]|nr:PhoH family protein [Gammaproteobacteria bacterium]
MADLPRLYILDTNVLMHDPTALFRFAEHDVFLPMIVLEELDRSKKGVSEVARNVRQVSRFIGQMMGEDHKLDEGLALREPEDLRLDVGNGRLYFQTRPFDNGGELIGDRGLADNEILLAALNMQQKLEDRQVVLVSKDINLRIKAAIHGITAEDYHNDRALDDLSLLYSGIRVLDNSFWDQRDTHDSWTDNGRTFYRIERGADDEWYPNQCLRLDDDNGLEAIVRRVEGDSVELEVARDYRRSQHGVWGIHARNPEQNFALNLLMDPEIDFVTLLGTAGTGKTLLALAAGLSQTLDDKIYREIIMTRATVSVGEEIGYLPGTEEEKMTPWMGALTDNLEVLTESDDGSSDWGRAVTNELVA